ncbi:ABC transporter ATP-binding protein [Aurantimicrobium minutum]|uniref:ABC transporter ATP-binding protein n=1 Tax=Aurantimicrobium minutum TaxID=708131 RepID=UPI002475AC88|nr:ABC transporter ATP-binding protein [Aurantimicrobium minutum]MDH6422292.1 multidrug/hemolysin transport system ATP-binding protein [Aurantimicrobium minutum]
MPQIRVSNLTKRFGSFTAVDDVSFAVEAGSLFAFLGANGAGKSTTIGCITTTLRPTFGQIILDGLDVATDASLVRRQIGVVFQNSVLDTSLTVKENLSVRAALYGLTSKQLVKRIGELSELVSLGDFLNRKYGLLSGGQKRKADIARALIHSPTVLFLDEPTAGLDPQSREQVWTTVDGLRKEHGLTVFLTTHYMEETERADNVCILSHGKVVAQGTPAKLRAKYSRSILTIRCTDMHATVTQALRAGFAVSDLRETGELKLETENMNDVIEFLKTNPVEDFEFRHGTMDDVFLTLTDGVIK